MLAALVARHDPNAGGEVHQAHRTLGDVLMLSAGAPGAERFDPALGEQLLVVSRDVEAVGARPIIHSSPPESVPPAPRTCSAGTAGSYGPVAPVWVLYGAPRPIRCVTVMIFDRSEEHPGARLLFVLACLVVVVYGLRYASAILLPSALALFLAVLSLPVMIWLRRRGVPSWLAILIPVVMNIAVIGLLLLIASQSVAQFQTRIGFYARELQAIQTSWFEAIEGRTGVRLTDYITMELINPTAVVDLARGAVGRAAQFVGTALMVFLIMAFMLSEATVFPEKFRSIMGDGESNRGRLTKVVTEVQTYLGIKTVVSLATGVVLGAWAWVMNLDFPILLGLLAFLLNYVPTVGSIIAAIPAVLLSLILVGTAGHALLVALGYGVVNTLFGNILEPNLMGRRLGLSTLVVILSLLFWGWAWGPLGAILSVPLTVIVKIWLENTHDLKWVAILLDKSPPPAPVVLSAPQTTTRADA
jgi:AI-2 transport protein TqsA